MLRNHPKHQVTNTTSRQCVGEKGPHRRLNDTAKDRARALQPSELTRIQRLIRLARSRCCALSDRQRFTLGLIGARVRKSGLTARISDDDRHLLNEIEARLFDLDDSDPPELSL